MHFTRQMTVIESFSVPGVHLVRRRYHVRFNLEKQKIKKIENFRKASLFFSRRENSMENYIIFLLEQDIQMFLFVTAFNYFYKINSFKISFVRFVIY